MNDENKVNEEQVDVKLEDENVEEQEISEDDNLEVNDDLDDDEDEIDYSEDTVSLTVSQIRSMKYKSLIGGMAIGIVLTGALALLYAFI